MSPPHQTQGLTVTIHVPLTFSIGGGRKSIVSGDISPPANVRTTNALLKALARAHRWRRQIEAGDFASISELAKAKGVNESYACRLLRLTLLAPIIVTNILTGRRKPDLMLKEVTKPFSASWAEQMVTWHN